MPRYDDDDDDDDGLFAGRVTWNLERGVLFALGSVWRFKPADFQAPLKLVVG